MATSSVSKSNALKCKGDGSPQHPARLLKARKRSNNGFIDFRVRAEGPDLARLETSSLRSLRSLQDKYKAVFDNGRSLAVARGGSISETVFKKRFEALLKGSIETSGSPKDGPITWMQIVRFAKSNSKDFECEASRDNLHWFQMDGVKVGIAYDDYLVICSGILFRLIAPSSTPCRVDLRNELTYLTKLEKRLEDIPGETQLCKFRGSQRMMVLTGFSPLYHEGASRGCGPAHTRH